MAEFVGEHPDWLAYQLPKPSQKHGLGQVQKWVLFLYQGHDSDIVLEPKNPEDEQEFRGFEWTTVRSLANNSVWFRKRIYKELADYFARYLAE